MDPFADIDRVQIDPAADLWHAQALGREKHNLDAVFGHILLLFLGKRVELL